MVREFLRILGAVGLRVIFMFTILMVLVISLLVIVFVVLVQLLVVKKCLLKLVDEHVLPLKRLTELLVL